MFAPTKTKLLLQYSMVSATSYLPAKVISSTLETHFAHQLDLASQAGEVFLSEPIPAHVIESLIDFGFWISVRKEEGYSPQISLAMLRPQDSANPLMFGQPMRLTAKNIIKISPAVVKPGIHLGVWYGEEGLYVWGTTQDLPSSCFVLQVIEPALLVVKHRRLEGFGKFVNVAIFKGDVVKIVDEKSWGLSDCPSLLAALMGIMLPAYIGQSVNILVELSLSMRSHKRGGLILIVPSNSDKWKESIVHPISYPIEPKFSVIANLLNMDVELREASGWQESLLKAVDIVGGFTAVDGATILNHQNELLAFGAKITRSENSPQVEQMIVTEPIADSPSTVVHPAKIGGTRHLAAAQFVHDQRDSTALVASQDGRFTVYVWSDQLKMVHAHRIDSLLL